MHVYFQVNLQEVSILTNSQPHDLVVQLRGGGLHNISDLKGELQCKTTQKLGKEGPKIRLSSLIVF